MIDNRLSPDAQELVQVSAIARTINRLLIDGAEPVDLLSQLLVLHVKLEEMYAHAASRRPIQYIIPTEYAASAVEFLTKSKNNETPPYKS